MSLASNTLTCITVSVNRELFIASVGSLENNVNFYCDIYENQKKRIQERILSKTLRIVLLFLIESTFGKCIRRIIQLLPIIY